MLVTFRVVLRDRDVDGVLGDMNAILIRLDGRCLAVEGNFRPVNPHEAARLTRERDRIRARARRVFARRP